MAGRVSHGAKADKPKKARGSRKSKAESMTGAKANEVESRSGELDLKPVEIDARDVQVHMRSIKAAMEKKDTAVSLLRSAKKNAKAVHPALADAIDKVIKLERSDSHHDLRQELEVFNIVLRETGAPIQISVHDTLLGDVVDQARNRGRKDAEGGKFASNPYLAGSDLAGAYSAGWEAVTAERVNGAGDPDEHPSNGCTELREEASAE